MLWVLIRSTEVLLMSIHNICFYTEIRNAYPDTTLLYSFGKRGVTGSDLAYYFIFSSPVRSTKRAIVVTPVVNVCVPVPVTLR